MRPVLPVGFHKLSPRKFVNYQLNRWHSEGYARKADLEEAGRRIRTFEDNKIVFVELADRALQEGRAKNAAAYLRAAEFLTDPADPEKKALYRRFNQTFYEAFAEDGIERHLVPFQGSHLPAMRLRTRIPSKGTVVIHGGFDSFIEEFYCFWQHFADAGYDVVAFEGPGQGAALAIHGIPHSHDWEKPVGAVLDHFRIQDCTLLGISFGGYWCVRAAAYEKRVKRLIVHAPLYDLMEGTGPIMRGMLSAMLRSPKLMDRSIRVRMRLIPTLRHTVRHAQYIIGKLDGELGESARWLMGMNGNHQHPELVEQDVLLLAGERDRFQPLKQYHAQMRALSAARSVTGRVFTHAEHAENHCQMGNLGLALDVMTSWLDSKVGVPQGGARGS